MRYRTGGGPGYTIDLTLASASIVQSVSTMIHSRVGGASGFAGLEVLVSVDNGGTYSSVYLQQVLFGAFDRHAHCFDSTTDCETPAPGFQFDHWTIHAFAPVTGVTNVRLHTGYADQGRDQCFSLNSITVDTPRTRVAGQVDSSYVPVVNAQWSSDGAGAGGDQYGAVCNVNCDNHDNRDSGSMADITAAIYPLNNFVRYRTGSAEGYTVDLMLAAPTDISGVSMLVDQHQHANVLGCDTCVGTSDAAGYSGIEIFVSTDNGATYAKQLWREEMFGSFERGAQYPSPASDFTFDQWTNHAFSQVQVGVTNLRLHFGHADQSGDSAVSFDSIRVDAAGAYPPGPVQTTEPPSTAVDATCAPVRDGPLDFYDLSGTLFACDSAMQTYTVDADVTTLNVSTQAIRTTA